jgi:hypothetical protein
MEHLSNRPRDPGYGDRVFGNQDTNKLECQKTLPSLIRLAKKLLGRTTF